MTKRKKRSRVVLSGSSSKEFITFAEHATAGVNASGMMLGILDDEVDAHGTSQWFAFALQVGACLLDAKPLLLICPTDFQIPEKLRLAATAVEQYTRGDMTSCELATKRALKKAGLEVEH